MKVAALQMVSGTQRSDNLAMARRLLEQAAEAGAELAVLPEYFCAMGLRDTDKLALRETPGEGVVQAFLARAAQELQLWVVGGTLPMQTADPARTAIPCSVSRWARSALCTPSTTKLTSATCGAPSTRTPLRAFKPRNR